MCHTDLDVRMNPSDRADSLVELVVGNSLCGHRRRLGHAVGDGDVAHVHALDDRLHDLGRARRPGNDAGTQRGQVVAVEVGCGQFGDEHRGHAVQAGARLPVVKVRTVEVVSQLLDRASRPGPLARLTPREREVLSLMAEGRANPAVARQLVISDKAVEKHVSSIFMKLDLPPTEVDHRRVLAVLRWLEG